MLTDVEIARNCKMKPIGVIAKELGLSDDDIECYGKYKAKISVNFNEQKGKLVLVTAMNPTPLGEGKTTMSIGLADGLRKIGKKSCLALREPSLGPVFGIKGGACGGGYAQVVPMEDINLHFTGDFHAITYANDLLSSIIDNHIKQGNRLDIAKVIWKRCIDLNDRALREIDVALGGDINGIPRSDGFTITAASEIMAILCLSTSLDNLKERLGNIVIGYNSKGGEITARELKVDEAMTILLRDAIKPNLVQTLEGTPAFIHGGPFANIAHGCNSILATKAALALSDYVITEAGFGAELGGEKFLDIKCRKAGISPKCCVLVVTIRSMKYNGGVKQEDTKIENLTALEQGFCNVRTHIENIKNVFNTNIILAINKFYTDTDNEIALVKKLAVDTGVKAIVVTAFSEGGDGAVNLAKEVSKICDTDTKKLTYAYELTDTIEEKINKVAKKVYHAGSVKFSEEAIFRINELQKDSRYKEFPVCIAKTQYSFSCNAEMLGSPKDYEFFVKDVIVRAGAGFIVVISGKILLMPGLPANPNSEKMTINSKGEIFGLM